MEQELLPKDVYKDPLKKNEKGFGFLGCMLQTKDESKVQCHICGELFIRLGLHIKSHKISAREYKEKFQLNTNTPLCSKKFSDEKCATYLARFSPEELEEFRKKYSPARFSKDAEWRKNPRDSLEKKNKKGSCPDQIIDFLKKTAEQLGHTPTFRELGAIPKGLSYYHWAVRTFKSYNNALQIANLPTNNNRGGGWKKEKTYKGRTD